MPSSTTWKYVVNQFDAATADSRVAMNKIAQDHDPKLKAASLEPGADPRLAQLHTDYQVDLGQWDTAYALWRNTKDGYGGGTNAFEGLLRALAVKASAEETSKVENWDSRIRAEVPHGGTIYTALMPQGRAPFSAGSREEILDAVKGLGTRLSAQTTKPALVALGVEVTGFYNQLKAARDAQQGMEGGTDMTADQIEVERAAMATALYGNLGMLMHIYRATPRRVAAFFDLDTLRQPSSAETTPPTGGGPTPPVSP